MMLGTRTLVLVLALAGVVMFNGREAGATVDPGWQEHVGRGYTLRHPAGWQVSETDENRILIESGEGRYTLAAVALPSVRPDNLSPHMVETCTGSRIDVRSFQRVNPFSMRAAADWGDTYETSAIMYQPVGNGITLMCATIVAGKSHFEAFAGTAARVVESMRPAAPARAAVSTADAGRVTDWTSAPRVQQRDPEEGSYTVSIPQGWSFRGGTGRVHVLETRQWFIASSPEGEITVIYGDLDVPRFVERDPLGMSPAGQWYTTQFSGNFFIWPYQHGLQFAQERAQNLFGAYADFAVDDEHQVDMTQSVQDAYAQSHPAVAQNTTSGISAFTFSHEGKKFAGAYWATTTRHADMGTWSLVQAVRIIATPERVEEAVNLAMTMMPQLDPQWQQQQNAGAMRNQRIMTESFAATNRIIRESYESRIASSERGTRDFVDGIWGTQRLQDPVTGQRYQMQHGSLSYWLHDDGTVVGTDTYDNPHPSRFRELLQVRN